MGQKEGVLTTGADHVEGGNALLGEAAPRNGEGLGEAGDVRKELIFPGAYCAFRRISAMHVRRCVLEARLLRLDEFLDLMCVLSLYWEILLVLRGTGLSDRWR